MIPKFSFYLWLFLLLLFYSGCGTTTQNLIHQNFPCHPEYKPTSLKLSQKADLLEKNLYKFIAPDGLLVYYRVHPPDSPPQKGNYGNASDSPIWTGSLLAAETLRYRVTRSPEALARIQKLIQGLHLLQAVTGVPGFLARFYDHGKGPNPSEQGHPDWEQGRGDYKDYRFRGDVSKDQYAGVLFGYTVAYHFLSDHPEIQQTIREDVLKIADHLIQNNYQLTNQRGEVTTYGDLRGRIGGAPIYLNALICLHAIALAREVSHHAPVYEEEWENLVRWKYPEITRVSKFQFLGVTNPSNDNMAFLCYYGLLLLLPQGRVREEIKASMDYVWSFIKAEGNVFWNFVYFAFASREKPAYRDSLRNLHLYPPHTRGYTVDNRNTPGMEVSFWKGRKGAIQSRYALPLNLRGQGSFIWKSSPYALYSPDEEGIEYTGTDYLLPYWMGRHHGFIEKDQ